MICAFCGKPISPKEHFKRVYDCNYRVSSSEKIRGVKKVHGMYAKTFKQRLAYTIHGSCMVKLTNQMAASMPFMVG